MQRKSNAGTLQRRGGAQPAFMSRGYSGKRTPVAEARRGDGWAAERRATAPADLPRLLARRVGEQHGRPFPGQDPRRDEVPGADEVVAELEGSRRAISRTFLA